MTITSTLTHPSIYTKYRDNKYRIKIIVMGLGTFEHTDE